VGALVEPIRVVIPRPRRGWIVGLLSGGIFIIARLLTAIVVLAVLAGVTVALWCAGQARVPVLVVVYGAVAAAGCGFAAGRSGRLLTLARRPHLPGGPSQLVWEPGFNRIETGLVWEHDNAVTGGSAEQEGCP
jgi:hypothetical protein